MQIHPLHHFISGELLKYFGDPIDPDNRARDLARLRKRRLRESKKA